MAQPLSFTFRTNWFTSFSRHRNQTCRPECFKSSKLEGFGGPQRFPKHSVESRDSLNLQHLKVSQLCLNFKCHNAEIGRLESSIGHVRSSGRKDKVWIGSVLCRTNQGITLVFEWKKFEMKWNILPIKFPQTSVRQAHWHLCKVTRPIECCQFRIV